MKIEISKEAAEKEVALISKRIFAWNLVGCISNAATSFLMLSFVTRNTNLTEAGYFSIAFATAQLFLTVGKYGVRAYQATDVKYSIERGSYYAQRAVTILGMLLLAFLFVLVSGYSVYKAQIVLCVCAIKALDAVEDVFHGELQRVGKMDTAGKLLTARNLFTVTVFCTVIYISKDLLFACATTFVSSLGVCLVLNLAVRQKQRNVYSSMTIVAGILLIFVECFPLFIGDFLSLIIYNVPKYVIDMVESSEAQAVYSMIFMPTFVTNMVSEFVFKPLLTPMASYWEEKDYHAVKRIMQTLFLAVAGITVIALLGGGILGIPLLNWFYAVDLSAYKLELMILLVGGGCSAAVYLSYNLLTLMRKQGFILTGYSGGLILMLVLAWLLVGKWGILGGTITYLLVEAVMALYFAGAVNMLVRRAGKRQNAIGH